MRLKDNSEFDKAVGFQIAPMIDVVFVIMLFFMVMAGAVKIENELNIKLPGVANPDSEVQLDETVINIDRNGQVSINDGPLDTPDSKDLPQLKATLCKIKQNADSAKTDVVVTIVSNAASKYGRTIDVLDSLVYAKINNVTFTVPEDDN